MSSAVAQPIQPPPQQFSHASPSDQYLPDAVQPQQQQHQSPDLSAPSPASSRRQASYAANGAPPNTPSSAAMHSSPNPSTTAVSTPRAQATSSARHTPASRSSAAASHDPYYSSGRSDQTSLPYRPSQQSQQGSSPYSERQDSARTTVPFNTPELSAGFELDRSRENAGSTPAAVAKREKREQRIFSEPVAAAHRPSHPDDRSKQTAQSRSAEGLSNQQHDRRPSPTREHSAVISRLVVTDPQVDVAREIARQADTQPISPQQSATAPATGLGLVGSEGVDDGGRSAAQQQRSRQEHLRNAQPRRETKFGDYILGQTVGEGEFGKVKLGWKKDGGVQVAIKLIRREVLGNNPNRLPKIYREIAILRGLQHPNIVRLHEMVETERHIGIILEYASGGELFDYILNHRYLKDLPARRLFAQLVSGVGYLHKRGIVHRDLKLENLLLDRNKNIIITDFGFANTFNTEDELSEEIEYNLSNKEYVQRMGLEQIRPDGHRRGDLMQTSCGSPCYAAPELVVSDTLYTGRKVDVWSCGVILYAMLAGYLPFDDDPSNPEGDNISLLYKYIVSTPLTFPEYVTPHARDLLRRILVPDPRKRADLFEVARHSWLSDYAHVVGFITSTTTTSADLSQANTADAMDSGMPSGISRSASVREPTRPSPQIGSAGRGPAIASTEERQKKERDAKRRTVQLEYVAPQMATQRGEPPQPPAGYVHANPQTRAKSATREPPAVADAQPAPSPSQRTGSMPPPSRASVPRAVSESATAFAATPVTSGATGRPSTRGSITGNSNARLPSRGNSYGQPALATVAPTNVEGRFSQPQRNSMILPGPISTEFSGRDPSTGRPMSQQFPVGYAPRPAGEARPRHKRTNTMESFTAKIFGRSNSVRKQSQAESSSSPRPERKNRQYPPVSMNNAMTPSSEVEISGPRRSTESRRSSLGFGRKSSTGLDPETEVKNKRASKRFSFIPQALSRMSLSGPSTKDETSKENKRQSIGPAPRSRHDSKFLSGLSSPGHGPSTPAAMEQDDSSLQSGVYDEQSRQRLPQQQGPQRGATAPDLSLFSPQSQYGSGYAQQQQHQPQQQTLSPNYRPSSSRQGGGGETFFHPSMSAETQATEVSTGLHPSYKPGNYPPGFNESDVSNERPTSGGRTHNTLQKPNRKLGAEDSGGAGGSSSGARRVMNWFRSRGRERGA